MCVCNMYYILFIYILGVMYTVWAYVRVYDVDCACAWVYSTRLNKLQS